MRFPGWVWTLLVVSACDKEGAAAPEPPITAAHEVRPPPRVSPRQVEELRGCTAVDPAAKGAVSYAIVVGPSGRVTHAKAANSTVSAAVLNCSLQRIRGWTFAATTDSTPLSFGVGFGPGGPTLSTGGDNKTLKTTLRHRAPQMQHCYNAALRDDPVLHGRATYTVFVSVTGEVTGVQVEEHVSLSQAVLDCTVAKIRGWRFPPSGAREGAHVTFSVVFSPADEPAEPAPTDTSP